jgi:hypothetical protein
MQAILVEESIVFDNNLFFSFPCDLVLVLVQLGRLGRHCIAAEPPSTLSPPLPPFVSFRFRVLPANCRERGVVVGRPK